MFNYLLNLLLHLFPFLYRLKATRDEPSILPVPDSSTVSVQRFAADQFDVAVEVFRDSVVIAIGTWFADSRNAALDCLGTNGHSVQANSLLDTD